MAKTKGRKNLIVANPRKPAVLILAKKAFYRRGRGVRGGKPFTTEGTEEHRGKPVTTITPPTPRSRRFRLHLAFPSRRRRGIRYGPFLRAAGGRWSCRGVLPPNRHAG